MIKRFGNPLLSLSAPLLIVIAIFGFFQRDETERLQALPALFVGAGLVFTGALGRRRRRKKLLIAIRQSQEAMK